MTEFEQLVRQKAQENKVSEETIYRYLTTLLIHPILPLSLNSFITGSTEPITTIKRA